MEVKADQLKNKEYQKEERGIRMTAAVTMEMAWVNRWLRRRRRSMKTVRKEEKERKEERALG